MEKIYSIFDAKAKLSEIIKLVKANWRVVITERGVPVVVLSPYTADTTDPIEKLERLEKTARVKKGSGPTAISQLEPLAVKAGGLARFLEDR